MHVRIHMYVKCACRNLERDHTHTCYKYIVHKHNTNNIYTHMYTTYTLKLIISVYKLVTRKFTLHSINMLSKYTLGLE